MNVNETPDRDAEGNTDGAMAKDPWSFGEGYIATDILNEIDVVVGIVKLDRKPSLLFVVALDVLDLFLAESLREKGNKDE